LCVFEMHKMLSKTKEAVISLIFKKVISTKESAIKYNLFNLHLMFFFNYYQET